MTRKILVTGGTGFIGVNLVRRLVAEGCDVTILVRSPERGTRLAEAAERIRVVSADLRDEAAVQQAVEVAQPEIVFHLASSSFASPSVSPQDHVAINIEGTRHLAEAVRRLVPPPRLVCAGTIAEYGSGSHMTEDHPLRPGSLFAASKAAASVLLETAARMWGLPVVILRVCMPYGPWEHRGRLIPSVILSALEGRDVPLTKGTQQRDLVYVDDVVEALWLAAEQPVSSGSVFNIGSGEGRSVREIVERLLALMGRPIKALWGAIPMRANEIMAMSADPTRAQEQLGWRARTSLDDGLCRSIAWWTANREPLPELAGGVQ